MLSLVEKKLKYFCLCTRVTVKGMVVILAGNGERKKNCREMEEYTMQHAVEVRHSIKYKLLK